MTHEQKIALAINQGFLAKRPFPKAVPDDPETGLMYVPPENPDLAKKLIKPPVIPEWLARSEGLTYDTGAIGTWVTGASSLPGGSAFSR